jgi:hypothetical protein
LRGLSDEAIENRIKQKEQEKATLQTKPDQDPDKKPITDPLPPQPRKPICDTATPTGETTTWVGWGTDPDNAKVGRWRQQLLPLSIDFSGCEVFEVDPGGGKDTCWYNLSAVFRFDKVSGGSWTVQPGNFWGEDFVGWHESAVDLYRKDGKAPCGTTFGQSMRIRRPSGGDQEYSRTQLAADFDGQKVSSTRAEQRQDKTWP